MFLFGNSAAERLVRFMVSGVNAIITDHFEMLFRVMLSQSGYEIEDRDCFGDEFFIFMSVVMKLDDRVTGMLDIDYFFKMAFKNLL